LGIGLKIVNKFLPLLAAALGIEAASFLKNERTKILVRTKN